ncbi:MAG: rod shape-determining protein [Clostridia bacterium]|nr:rod shape-determining protein [Oscillospiraceae bacterium]MBQ7959977.1 rod shape-determining protein [Clostridia bacterium]
MANEIGIDLGTANTIIYLKGKGIVVNEPTVVAVSRTTGKILSIGKEAGEMLGRTPVDICAVTPIKEGVIANFDITVSMLRYFIKKAIGASFLKPRAVVCIPSHITDVEKRAVRDAVLAAGVKEVFLLEKSMAAAIGAGISVNAPVGSMVCDIGGGTTEIAVVSLGGIVATQSLKVASQTFDSDIILFMKKNHNLIIGNITAEEIKMEVGSACSLKEELSIEIKGRDLVSGLPRTAKVTSEEIREAIQESLATIIDGIKAVLEKTPPELAADIIESGIVLTGGGSILKGLGRLINAHTDIPIFIAESPAECVAIGAGKALEEIKTLHALLISE